MVNELPKVFSDDLPGIPPNSVNFGCAVTFLGHVVSSEEIKVDSLKD